MSFAIVTLAFLSVIAFTDWKRGIYLSIITAFLQDPLRKLLPEQPAICILFAASVFAAATVGAVASNVYLGPAHIPDWKRYLNAPFWAFIILLIIQSGNSLIRFENIAITSLGIINYSMPVLALLTAFSFFSQTGMSGILRLLTVYVFCSLIALFTVYLESTGLEWQVLGEVGAGVRIHFFDIVAKGNAGIFRASEIAAWHAGMTACILMITLSARRIDTVRMILLSVLAPACVGVGLLTGRRKMVMLVLIFVVCYIGLQLVLQKRSRATALVVSFIGLTLYSWQIATTNEDPWESPSHTSEYDRYAKRSKTVFGDATERFTGVGLASVGWAEGWFGPLGGGVGVGTQGAGKFGNTGEHVGAAEGGLGRITLELGLPGLAIVIFSLYSLGRHIWGVLQIAAQHSPAMTRLGCGLCALLVANAANFTVATQAYGDAFIMLFLGMILAAILVIPYLILSGSPQGVSVIRIDEQSPVSAG